MSTKKIDIVGRRFGSLIIVNEIAKRNKNGHILYLCKCDCGKTKEILGSSIRQNLTTSCGCVHKNKVTKHGMDGTRVYRIWVAMRNRCNNQNNRRYGDYGGRGINVCDEWNSSFECFFRDMGEPRENESIERLDNLKGYSKENCIWATNKDQCNNRRSSVRVFYNGDFITIEDYSKFIGLSLSGARKRVEREFNRINGVFVKSTDAKYNEILAELGKA